MARDDDQGPQQILTNTPISMRLLFAIKSETAQPSAICGSEPVTLRLSGVVVQLRSTAVGAADC